MSDADWEKDDFGFQRIPSDKWEGEDEEDDVKDNWEDEEEEKRDAKPEETASSIRAFQKKKKRPIAEIIAEKEAQQEKLKDDDSTVQKVESPEDQNAEKLRRRQLQEESDLKLAKDAFGLIEGAGIDQMSPESEEDFVKFEEALKEKITSFEKSPHYTAFLDKLFTDLIINVESDEIRKINASLSSMYHEKLKQLKESEKKKKKKTKASIKFGKENELDDIRYDDFAEDFM